MMGCSRVVLDLISSNAELGSYINVLGGEPREIKKELLINSKQLDSILAEGCQRECTVASLNFKGGIPIDVGRL